MEFIFRNIDGKEISRYHYIVKECINGWELRNIETPRFQKSLKFCYRYEIVGNIYDNPELLKEAGSEAGLTAALPATE